MNSFSLFFVCWRRFALQHLIAVLLTAALVSGCSRSAAPEKSASGAADSANARDHQTKEEKPRKDVARSQTKRIVANSGEDKSARRDNPSTTNSTTGENNGAPASKSSFSSDASNEQAAVAKDAHSDSLTDVKWIANLASRDSGVRENAQRRLDGYGARARKVLVAALKHPDNDVQQGAAFFLLPRFQGGDEELSAAFVAGLADDDPTVRSLAAQTIRKMAPEYQATAAPKLANMLLNSSEPLNNRVKAAQVLGSLDQAANPALSAIQQAMRSDRETQVRTACLLAFAKLAPRREAVPVLIEIVQNERDSVVRRAAVARLGAFGSVEAAPALANTLGENDDDLRETAIDALGKIGQDAVKPLIAQLESPQPEARRWSAFALGELGKDARIAIPALRKLLNDKDPGAKEAAQLALEAILSDL